MMQVMPTMMQAMPFYSSYGLQIGFSKQKHLLLKWLKFLEICRKIHVCANSRYLSVSFPAQSACSYDMNVHICVDALVI